MSPLIAYHATRRACRESILRNGLLCSRPRPFLGVHHPFGVYVFREDGSFDHPCMSRTVWGHAPRQDLWEVAYIGPMMTDPYVLNAVILLLPADHVTLMAGNNSA